MVLPSNNMNLNLYRVFYTVAKTRSFSESTKMLHISQPAISKHIQNLEYELNTQLFRRTNRGIELTDDAKMLLQYIEKAYNYLQLGERELIEGKEQEKSVISIGAPSHITTFYIKDQITSFITTHPNVSIKVSDSPNFINALLKHELDLVFLSNNTVTNKKVKEETIFTDKYCFAAHINYPALESITTLAEIIANHLIVPPTTTEDRQALERYLTVKNLKLTPYIELENIDMILNYTKDGLGIGYLPMEVVKQNPDLKIIELTESLPEKKISILYNPEYITTSSKQLLNELFFKEETNEE